MGIHGLEACVQVAYDTRHDCWVVIVPEQKVTSVSVEYDPNESITMTALEDGLILVADIHSHHKMPAYFSGIDDRDEVGVRLYGVFGCMKGTHFEILFRAGAGGHFARVPAEDILENYYQRDERAERLADPSAPMDWLAKVSTLS